MACKNANNNLTIKTNDTNDMKANLTNSSAKLIFGIDSKIETTRILQNNLTEFEWAARNKIYPNFCGRNISGENCLTKEEIVFLHKKGCKICAIYTEPGSRQSEKQGKIHAKKAAVAAIELGIPENSVIFLELGEKDGVTRDYLKGYAEGMLIEGYTPGFMANTDSAYGFDREYSRGIQTDKELFEQCLVWATAPSFKEYERVTTTHLIHPDRWSPFSPSGITVEQIAVWQYGKDCHPIHDNADNETAFNVNLVRNAHIIIDKMF